MSLYLYSLLRLVQKSAHRLRFRSLCFFGERICFFLFLQILKMMPRFPCLLYLVVLSFDKKIAASFSSLLFNLCFFLPQQALHCMHKRIPTQTLTRSLTHTHTHQTQLSFLPTKQGAEKRRRDKSPDCGTIFILLPALHMRLSHEFEYLFRFSVGYFATKVAVIIKQASHRASE